MILLILDPYAISETTRRSLRLSHLEQMMVSDSKIGVSVAGSLRSPEISHGHSPSFPAHMKPKTRILKSTLTWKISLCCILVYNPGSLDPIHDRLRVTSVQTLCP